VPSSYSGGVGKDNYLWIENILDRKIWKFIRDCNQNSNMYFEFTEYTI